MRSCARAGAAMAVLVAATLAPSSPAAAACRQAEDVVLASNAHVRVVGDWIECDSEPGRSYFNVSAGLRPAGPMHSLDHLGVDVSQIQSLRLRGRYVAYLADWHAGEEDATELSLMNVRTGAIHLLDFVAYAGREVFGSYVLKPNGSTAWIVDETYGDESGDGRPQVHVRRCPRASCLRTRARRPVTVDARPGIRMRPLRLDGSKIAWLRGGAWRRATLR